MITNCRCESNGAEGICLDNGCLNPIVMGCRIADNQGGAGGISVDECLMPVIIGCTLLNNKGLGEIRYNCNTGRVDNGVIAGNSMVCAGKEAISIGNLNSGFGGSAAIVGNVGINTTPNPGIVLHKPSTSTGWISLSVAGNFWDNIGNTAQINNVKSAIRADYNTAS